MEKIGFSPNAHRSILSWHRFKVLAFSVITCLILTTVATWYLHGWYIDRLHRRIGYTLSAYSGSEYPPIPWHHYENMFVFGDSWSSCFFNPHGDQPSTSNPFGNPQFPHDRPEGPLWVHYITEKYNESHIFTYDLAAGGSTIDQDIAKSPFDGKGLSLKEQVDDAFVDIYGPFASDDRQHTRWNPETTLFALWFGASELGIAYESHEHVPIAELFGSFHKSMKKLYDNGARRFLVMTVPPMHLARSPLSHTANLEIQISDWNRELRILIDDINSGGAEFPDANVLVFNANAALEHIHNDPEAFEQTKDIYMKNEPCLSYAFGVNNAKEKLDSWGGIEWPDHHSRECEAPLSRYFWMNTMHITYPVHDALASLIVADCFKDGGKPRRFCSR